VSLSIPSTFSMPALGAASASKPAGARSPADEFLALAQKSPAERMRDLILGKMGLTEQQLQAMDTESRKKIEEKIKEEIKKIVENSVEERTGMLIDLSV
jgi:TPP-dependent pyruvate/acetoin dehydrogenase alpha subunit